MAFREEGTHRGVDSETGIVHSTSTTAANVHDITEAHSLLHGGEVTVWGDAGYTGAQNGRRTGNRQWTGRWRCVPASARNGARERGGVAGS